MLASSSLSRLRTGLGSVPANHRLASRPSLARPLKSHLALANKSKNGKYLYSSNSGESKDAIKYGDTLNLPKTDFPMRADAAKREPGLLNHEVYSWQQNRHPKTKRFVMHDGPPYANGSPHIGHALNKILKDIVNRYKIMQGFNVSYIPGWDCHGLPIEMKVLEKLPNEVRQKLTPLELRKRAKEYALSQIEIQKKEFKRWGVIGDWERPYLTMDAEYEAEQISVFSEMVRKGLIYRDFKPVYWSPSSRTALAEAELEYKNDHVSPSVYVLFPFQNLCKMNAELASLFSELESKGKSIYASIWTTTPWTLPSNLAICVGENIKYSAVEDPQTGNVFIVASDLISNLSELTKQKYQVLVSGIAGKELVGSICHHPFEQGRTSVLLAGNHVTVESGTGLVHTAPGHGQDDFIVCKNNGIPPLCPVDDAGKFTSDAGPHFEGKFVLTEGNEAVLNILKSTPNTLLFQHNYTHKYPYDWRTKKPIIVRATRQWFCDLRVISQNSVSSLANVQVIPSSGLKRLESMLGTRQDWCISRQRSWGVPIPVLYDVETDEALLTDESISHIRDLIKIHGADCWWSLPVEELLAPEYRANGKKYRKGTDTMDVWFDSGTSWAGVLRSRGLPTPADLYLEGSDQHRGWFQSSLLTSIACHDQAPYKTLVTHGFLLDENYQKMSKSLGNVIEPSHIIDGGKDKNKNPSYGVDVMRLWVASTDYTDDVTISDSLLASTFNMIKKLRNTARFMLGNLNGFNPSTDSVKYSDLHPLDKYMLHKLSEFISSCAKHYDAYHFFSVVREVNHFANTDLSAFYLNILKDRLYAEPMNSSARRSAQTTIAFILDAFAKILAPITCHTSEDIWKHMPWKQAELDKDSIASVFCEGWPLNHASWKNNELEQAWEQTLELRSDAYRAIEKMRSSGTVNTSSETDIIVYCRSDHPIRKLSEYDLSELFITGQVLIEPRENVPQELIAETLKDTEKTNPDTIHTFVQAKVASLHRCVRCWRHVCHTPNSTCSRCDHAMSQFKQL